MIAWVDGRIVHHCVRCWTPLAGDGEFCSVWCEQQYEPAWRCPGCVTKQLDPCLHELDRLLRDAA